MRGKDCRRGIDCVSSLGFTKDALADTREPLGTEVAGDVGERGGHGGFDRLKQVEGQLAADRRDTARIDNRSW